MKHATALDYAGLEEDALLALAKAGDRETFRVIMTRSNQRLFRIARAIVGNDDEAEDVLQEAYLRAFANIAGFRGGSSLLTWLGAITLNEARGRLRRRRPTVALTMIEEQPNIIAFPAPTPSNPEAEVARAEIRRLLEQAVDELPPDFRVAFLLREVEGCSIEETAAVLDIRPATVKTRHHRACRLLRHALDARLSTALRDTFPFLGARCSTVTDRVMAKLDRLGETGGRSP
ncbi:RNA polymerase sigma factor [Aliidongia dinghuensis]|uniref:RNA polymerase sigma factor n=1 Tax=Aliidongia dinghuensis TaxID=1867774 RepID=A0A8J2YQC0_9PROT|nr:RNA polymerase sigma factor [Aliidongia dinghuensis]GGF04425.1 RNA polymerase sigma factor [Aliidongia dinghuensis]